jgi:hypothetical protein
VLSKNPRSTITHANMPQLFTHSLLWPFPHSLHGPLFPGPCLVNAQGSGDSKDPKDKNAEYIEAIKRQICSAMHLYTALDLASRCTSYSPHPTPRPTPPHPHLPFTHPKQGSGDSKDPKDKNAEYVRLSEGRSAQQCTYALASHCPHHASPPLPPPHPHPPATHPKQGSGDSKDPKDKNTEYIKPSHGRIWSVLQHCTQTLDWKQPHTAHHTHTSHPPPHPTPPPPALYPSKTGHR